MSESEYPRLQRLMPLPDVEWNRVKAIFQAALDRPADARSASVDAACTDDAHLRAAVYALLAAYEQAPAFMERPAVFGDDTTIAVAGVADARTWVGRRLGAYRIVRELGRGGMGRVFLADRADAQFDRQVAIKIVRETADVDLLVDRFAHEREILATFDHQNISRLLDAGVTEDGVPYVVMEYVDGVPIDTYCTRHQLSTGARLELFRQVCMVVHHAHQHFVIHRDLKPANILVTDDGIPKLLDFGIAKLVEPSGSEVSHTRTAQRMLTPATAAPEQVTGGRITAATDVYALGLLLCQLMTGQLPYRLRDATEAELVRAICETEPEKPSALVLSAEGTTGARSAALRQQLAGDIDTIVLQALQKAPHRRYSSAEDLAADVRRHLDGLPVRAVQDSIAYRVRKFIRRHRTYTAASAAAVIVMSAAVSTIPALRPRTTAATATSVVSSLAIVPFRELGVPLADGHLGWGVADALIARLNRLESLQTRLVGSVVQPDPRDGGSAAATGARLGVAAVIEGSVQQSAGRVRVTTRLVDVHTRTALWSSVAEDATDRLFHLEDKVTLDVARRLSPRLDLSGLQARARTTNPAAYDAYVNGRYRLNLRTADEMRLAITYFERAIREDAAFAPAHAGLADAWAVLGDSAALSISHLDTLPRAREAARRAVALDDSLAEAHASLGWVTLIFDWNWPAAAQEFKRALELDPRYTVAAAWYAAGLASQGQFDEAIGLLRDAAARDPFSRPVGVQLVRVLYLARRFGEVDRECARMAAADTTFGAPSTCELARLQIGDTERALKDLRSRVGPGSESASDLGAIGYAYGETGRRAEAFQVLEQLRTQVERRPGLPYYLAEVYAGLGDHDATLASLEQARQQRWPTVILRVLVDPKFDLLTDEERARLVVPPSSTSRSLNP